VVTSKLQMRFSSISGIADECQYLPAPHANHYSYAQTSRLQMHVICELAATQVDCDCIGRHCFRRNWRGRVERVAVSGDVIGRAVPCRNDAAISNRQHYFSVGLWRPESSLILLDGWQTFPYRIVEGLLVIRPQLAESMMRVAKS
jgi:hypothetical protein